MSAITIAQMSDLHCGSPHFVPSLLDRAIAEVNELAPDVVIVSGDLTSDGFRAASSRPRASTSTGSRCERHDRDPRQPRLAQRRLRPLRGAVRRAPLGVRCTSTASRSSPIDSTEPDLDHGTIGRGRYGWIEECFGADDAYLRVFVLHHHLLPVPGTGRERNVVHDAGDTLECLQRADCHLVLSGHKHVPYAWRLEDLFVVNAGTVSTTRLRGKTKPCYNVIEASPERVTVFRKYPVPRAGRDPHVRPPDLRLREAPTLLGETATG